ncbi:protein dehydratase [Agrobacterium rubi]|uniref:FAS1-like dehydratase domain-containing protein n=1 Tax=Agrobacterium rubi TaxID=28099 RepID=UPI001571C63C|nr:MaoC family dehydratase N-terminal domain-containing protein [Agrobacterium rubi]NTF10572.1 protein dehydratase [Agrobacterium rubi]NTF22966.1 protein dehydratase [Agrobacterium rubi]NTF29897.1 protein dehydratase [Agrobacterium rubi]
MSALAPFDIQHLRSWIGREEVASDIISIDLVHKFKCTLNLPAGTPIWGETAPMLIHYCLAQPAAPTDLLGDDGHPERGGFLPPVPLPRRMWAGSDLAFRGDLRVGDLVRRVSCIADVVVKEGRSGMLCFVKVEHNIDVAGSLKIEETQNIVYREAARQQDVTPPQASAPLAANSRAINVSTPLLFRYSALTFNGHRIHYDRRYAMEVEHYPGLVLHGPLQATLLLNYAAELKGGAPARFTFKGLSPLFDNDKVYLHSGEEDGRMKLWTARESGPVAMSAEAIWS